MASAEDRKGKALEKTDTVEPAEEGATLTHGDAADRENLVGPTGRPDAEVKRKD